MPMRFYYDADEWYPVLSLVEKREDAYNDQQAEFSEDEIARIKRAFEEFEWAQQLLRERFEY